MSAPHNFTSSTGRGARACNAPAVKYAACLLVGVLLAGCSSAKNAATAFQQSYRQSFHSSFRKQFRVSFVKSCTAGPGMTIAYCGCVADKFALRLNDAELIADATDPSKRDDMQAGLQEAAHLCRDKFGR